MKRRAQLAARWRQSSLAGLALCLGTALLPAYGSDSGHADKDRGSGNNKDRGPKPAVEIPVEPLGYRPPGRLYLLSRFSSSSLDFLDEKHILLTFREPHLLQRSQSSPDGLDQVVHVAVLELSSGRVTAEDNWLLHDRGRYLWRLGNGRMMLRIGSHLYEVDDKLQTREIYQSQTELEGVDVTPDGRLLVVEEELEKHDTEEHDRLMRQAALRGAAPPPEDVRVRMIRLDGPELLLTGRAPTAGEVPATIDGFFRQSERKEDAWDLLFVSYETAATGNPAAQPVAQLASTCAPTARVLNSQTVLMLSCPPGHDGRFASAYSRDGRKLWDGSWNANYTWPAFRVSENGMTVAISWLTVTRPVTALDPINDDEVKRQVLSVLDSRSGNLRFAMLVDPIVDAGGNFALSPDGDRLAVLNQGKVQVYDLAPAAAERGAK